ncbi:MAG: hypothetical protein U0936_06680 [Planctomycetaceae bacterium]
MNSIHIDMADVARRVVTEFIVNDDWLGAPRTKYSRLHWYRDHFV